MFNSIIDKAAEKFIENFVMDSLRPFGPQDLSDAVKSNLSLLDECQKFNPGSLSMAEKMAKQFNGQSRHLTTENVLKWISDKRPDLYFAMVYDYKKKMWLDRQVQEFRSYLFEY